MATVAGVAADAPDSRTPPLSDETRLSGSGSMLRYSLVGQGLVRLCKLCRARTVVSKLVCSRYFRRLETHSVQLDEAEMRSLTPQKFFDAPLPYYKIEEVSIVVQWEAKQQYCLRLDVDDSCYVLYFDNRYTRDQWLHSIQWKRNAIRYKLLLAKCTRQDVIVKEMKSLVAMTVATPIQGEEISNFAISLASDVLHKHYATLSRDAVEQVMMNLAPLLDNHHPTAAMCQLFIEYCKLNPRSHVIVELFTPVVQRLLKHSVDYGEGQEKRSFVIEYLEAISFHNDGLNVIAGFIQSAHGSSCTCPHPRVLPNVVAVCLSAIDSCYRDLKCNAVLNDATRKESTHHRLDVFLHVLQTLSQYSDWLPMLSCLLQPVPFVDSALLDGAFARKMAVVMRNIAADPCCEVHQCLLGLREGKNGWFNVYAPMGVACHDEGDLWGYMLTRLLSCCLRRKPFLSGLVKLLGSCLFLALRSNEGAIEALAGLLEYGLIDREETVRQIVSTLHATSEGKKKYAEVCSRQVALHELQQKGGPVKLTLPTRSTDADLSKLLSGGSFGNLQCLSLAFTSVTSACANDLIKLPSLRYLNLWGTQFGDSGLQIISEHLVHLQVLNLCETAVTDKGLKNLAAMKHLRHLNLNSTSLSALTFESLKEELPALLECDVRYTDAWTWSEVSSPDVNLNHITVAL